MSVSQNPSIIRDGLLLSVDFANRKAYTPGENLFQYSQVLTASIYSKQISDIITTNATLAPDNTITADLLTANTPVVSPSPFIYQSYTTNVPTYYTFSCFVKPSTQNTVSLLLGTNRYLTTTQSGALYFRNVFNMETKTFTNPQFVSNTALTGIFSSNNFSYGYKDYPNGWIRLYMTANILAANSSNTTHISAGLYVGNHSDALAANNTGIYTWGWQLEQSNTVGTYIYTDINNSPKSNVVIDSITNKPFNIEKPEYVSFANNTIEFNRTPTTSEKNGASIYTVTSGNLNPLNFLYNDHTWEIWVKVNDINPGIYDGNETQSIITAYSGWHAGFIYSNSSLRYTIFDGLTQQYPAIFSLGISNSNINQGIWYQIVVVSLNKTFTSYLNGVQIGSKTTVTLSTTNVQTGPTLCIGSCNPVISPNFKYYSKISFSNMKMYNVALSDVQVKQNFNALRKRFNL